ncbi:hypothetical protein SUGI_0508050 [Cryptomeria japonica]|nr:hypothetical protein SUGI_0508050 [Cryptomeria japonica]
MEVMAMATSSAHNASGSGYVFARSDGELEEQVREAIEASNDDFAFRIQLQEILRFSDFTFAYNLQLADINTSLPASSSFSDQELLDEYEFLPKNQYEQGQDYQGRTEKAVGSWQCPYRRQGSVPTELCGICFEDSLPEMFEGMHCLHRFCHSCMTQYIHSRLQQKRQNIYCPQDSCQEALTPQECRYFLPSEIFDQWSAVIVEAQIPESEKVYCPFPNCSGLLVKEDVASLRADDILNAECPFCNRMFCVRCMVPWHAELTCSQFQNLPPAERSEADLQLFKLAQDCKWQRCGKCKGMIELAFGCNHMTCRCGHEFCYVCGTEWANGCPNCSCPRTTVNRLTMN